MERYQVFKLVIPFQRHELSQYIVQESVYLEINYNICYLSGEHTDVLTKTWVKNNNKHLYHNNYFPYHLSKTTALTHLSLWVKDIVMISTWLDAFTFMVVCIFSTGGEVKRAESGKGKDQVLPRAASLSVSINKAWVKRHSWRKKAVGVYKHHLCYETAWTV